MIHKTASCPMYLAENGQWSSSMSPYCSCGDTSTYPLTYIPPLHNGVREKEPIGVDCWCELGSKSHYHPDCEYFQETHIPKQQLKEDLEGKIIEYKSADNYRRGYNQALRDLIAHFNLK